MSSIKFLAPLSAALLLTLAACQQESPTSESTPQTEPQPSAPPAAAAPAAPVAPGASGLLPATAGGFSAATEAQRTALQDAGKAPCSIDVLNGAARGTVERVTVERAGNLEAIGWVLNPRKEVPREFAIVLSGDAAAYVAKGAAGGARPDVAKVFSAESATPAGYRAGAALAEVEPGEYAVLLAQDTHDALTSCDTGWQVRVSE